MKQKALSSLSGFTLVELVVVMAVFAILMIAGTSFFLQVIQNSNQASIRNEVRQNASSILQRFRDSVRGSSCVTLSGTQTTAPGGITVTTYSTLVAPNICSGPLECFQFKTDGTVLWAKASGGTCTPVSQLSSGTISVVDCQSGICGTACAKSGAAITKDAVTGSIALALTVQQKTGVSRADQCGRITLTDTVTPRQY